MPIATTFQRILDRKQWEMVSPAPSASTTGSFIVSSTAFDQYQFFSNSLTGYFLYYPADDAWLQLPSSGLAGSFGNGSCGCYHPHGPTGNATATAAIGTSTISISTSPGIFGSLAGYKIRITGGAGIGQERTIASNTFGTSSVVTVTSPWTTALDTTSTYVLLTGRFWVFCGNNATAQGFKFYDVAMNAWSSATVATGLPASFATDARLVATPGGTAFASGTATSATATTLVKSGANWTTNQWTNFQIRITGGTGIGQVKAITLNDATSVTVVSEWTTVPDATSTFVIEGNDDFLYLHGSGTVTTAMYRYSIYGTSGQTVNTWSALATRANASSTGMSMNWVTKSTNSLWTAENATINGRRIYSFRGGGTASLDYYDIPSNTWTASVSYLRAAETFTTGSAFTLGADGIIYIHKDGTSRFFKYDVANQIMDAWSVLPYPQSTALAGGDRVFTVDFTSGSDSLRWVYHLRNNSTEMFRCLVF